MILPIIAIVLALIGICVNAILMVRIYKSYMLKKRLLDERNNRNHKSGKSDSGTD